MVKPEEVMVGIILSFVLAIFAWMAGSAFAKAGASSLEVGLLSAAILFGGIAFGGLVRLVPRQLTITSATLCIVALVILGVLHFRVVPFCGDNVCGAGECDRCASDCKPEQCADGRCDAPKERCDTTPDCKCAAGEICAPGRARGDSQGCLVAACGDGFCDAGESTLDCCADCGCTQGFLCQENACIFQRPILTISPYSLTDRISVTSLAGNPMLTNSSGESRPLAGLRIQTTGYARAMNVTFAIGDLVSETKTVGTLKAGEEVPVLWYVKQDSALLRVIEDRQTNISVTITYLNAIGDKQTSRLSLPLTLLNRSTLDRYGHIALFVTKDIRTRERTPQGIWEELRQNMTLEEQNESIKFPLQTLRDRQGSPRDFALLLASAYDTAGLNPSLVEGRGGEAYVRVKVGDRFVTLDPARLDQPFDQAVVSRPGAALYDVRRVRLERNLTVLALNDSLIPGDDISAQTALDQLCACATCGTKAVAVHMIANDGLVPAQFCATSRIAAAHDGELLDARKSCYTLAAGERVEFRHGWRGSVCEEVTATLAISKS